MGSRLKQNPEQTFYWFFEATCPIARDKDPGLLFRFPEDFSDEESCTTLPRFCFPYDIQRVRDGVAVQHFTFVLTDLEGCQRFGFCRLTNNTQTCLCILSYLPWFEVFYKLLNNLADYLAKGQTNEMKELLAELYKQPLPLAAGSVTLQMGEQLLVSTEVSRPVGYLEGQEGIPYFIAPDPRSLPSIPENRNLTELIVAVDVSNLIQLYASMLFERRILIFATKLSTLTACVHALSAVLYPMYWQHIFIPVLPPHLLDYCCAPMPYLIGVHTSLTEKVRSRGLEEVVILNVDTNTLETPFDDLKRIPSEVMSGLKVCLKRQAVSSGCGVSRAFLRAQALLFGGYRDALQGHKEGEMWFSEELFLDHKSHTMRQFLQSAVHLQFFKQFIDSHLEILNEGKEPDDLFEEEILQCGTTAGRSKSYQQLVGNLKKGGGALILNMKSKANIKAKGLTKTSLKNLLMHKDHNEEHTLQRAGSVSHRRAQSDCLQKRLPITSHFGMSRPHRPVHNYRASSEEENIMDVTDTWDGAESGPVAKPDSELQKEEEEQEESLLCDSEEMDLLGEIFDTLSSRSFYDRGLLYGTRSLDLFGPDSHDYITKGSSEPQPGDGSGSLHSWNLETTEEVSDLVEDPDWLCLDVSVPEEEGSESLLLVCKTEEQERGHNELREKQENVAVVVINESKGEELLSDRNNYEEVELEEEKKKADDEKKVSFGEDAMIERVEKQENEELEENKEGERNQNEEKEMKRATCEMQNALVRKDEGKESQEKEKDMAWSLNRNKYTNAVNEVEEHGQDDTSELKTTASPGPPNIIADPEYTASVDQERRDEETVGKEMQEIGQTSCTPPKVLSAVARFQSQASSQSFQMKSWTKSSGEPGRPCSIFRIRENSQTNPPNDSNPPTCVNVHSEATEEEDPPPIKVSELKKRFEA
ncbi:hypothetical protein LDENG_00098680 [Lucifuga dentata]|nr:hypothetical protein LDENG_00098680 [Lucifuga dentata]